MSEDTGSKTGWGILLGGDQFDLEDWQETLKPPFDPWITKTDDGLILRGPLLDSATTSSEAHYRGMELLAQANGALGASRKTGIVRLEAVVEFLPDGRRQRHTILWFRASDARDRARMVVAVGPDGNPPPPEPSVPQSWLAIAAKNDLLADALRYFGRGESWFDMYKALECIEDMVRGQHRLTELGCVSAGEIRRLKQTANSYARHRRGRFDPGDMEITEARELLRRLIASAFATAT
jgi:hypothetical protein